MNAQPTNPNGLYYKSMINAAKSATVDKGAELTSLYSNAILNDSFLEPVDAFEAVAAAKDKDRNRAVILYTADMTVASFSSLVAIAASTSPDLDKQAKALVRIIKAMMIVDSLSANIQLNNWTHNNTLTVAPVAAVEAEQA